jgi:hypothetical protein
MALTAAAFALTSGVASAVVPTKACGTLSAKGKSYKVRGHLVGCNFARLWTSRYLKSGRRPTGWRCRRYSARESRIAFVCRKGGTDFYAVRR